MDSARILKAVLSQETAVNCAAEFGHAETVKISGENGVDLNARDVWQVRNCRKSLKLRVRC